MATERPQKCDPPRAGCSLLRQTNALAERRQKKAFVLLTGTTPAPGPRLFWRNGAVARLVSMRRLNDVRWGCAGHGKHGPQLGGLLHGSHPAKQLLRMPVAEFAKLRG
jgi:hypothetical protein